jgi:glutamate racemase
MEPFLLPKLVTVVMGCHHPLLAHLFLGPAVEVAVLLQEGQQSARVARVVVAMEEWQKVQHQPQMGKQILAAAVVVVPVLAVEIGLAATVAPA